MLPLSCLYKYAPVQEPNESENVETPDPVKPSTPASPEKRKKHKQKIHSEPKLEIEPFEKKIESVEEVVHDSENTEKESDEEKKTITVEISQTVNVESTQNETDVTNNSMILIDDEKSTKNLPFDKTIDADTLAANHTTKELKQFGKELGISLNGKKADMAVTILNNL